MCDFIEYLGHIMDADGIQATPEEVAAIEKAPQMLQLSQWLQPPQV